jgi:hypothetical protein
MNFALLLLCGLSLQTRYERILLVSSQSSAPVLKIAKQALEEGSYQYVGIEDLWAVALKEGKNRFGNPKLWSATTAQQTGDMLGQTTIGPWQITLQNIRLYGTPYGISKDWEDSELIAFLETRPVVQAHLAADLLEAAYNSYGKRTPYALQSYFWLDGFLQKKIGQGPWYDSVLARDPAAMRNTGFYAKQLLLGSRFNPQGLLYWLWITGDDAAIKEALEAWRDHGYPITSDDLDHCNCEPPFQDYLRTKKDVKLQNGAASKISRKIEN